MRRVDPQEWDDLPPEWLEYSTNASFLAAFEQEHGFAKFKELMAMVAEKAEFGRERLQLDADRLMRTGKRKLAVEVAKAAKRCPSLADSVVSGNDAEPELIGREGIRREISLLQTYRDNA